MLAAQGDFENLVWKSYQLFSRSLTSRSQYKLKSMKLFVVGDAACERTLNERKSVECLVSFDWEITRINLKNLN